MKILIYISKDRIARILASPIKRSCSSLQGIVDIECVEFKDINEAHKKMNSADIIIIFAHGLEDKLYHKKPIRMGDEHQEQVLINMKNCDIFSNKKVITFSCLSAKKLGPYCVDNKQCRAYIGFNSAIDFGTKIGKNSANKVKHFFYRIYSSVMDTTIREAINNNFTAKQFSRYFEHKLTVEILKHAENNGIDNIDFKECLRPEIIHKGLKTATGIRALGEIDKHLLS